MSPPYPDRGNKGVLQGFADIGTLIDPIQKHQVHHVRNSCLLHTSIYKIFAVRYKIDRFCSRLQYRILNYIALYRIKEVLDHAPESFPMLPVFLSGIPFALKFFIEELL